MTDTIEELRAKFDIEELACQHAADRIERGGLLGKFVGRVQRWIHEGQLQQVTDELEVAELRERLHEAPSPQVS